MEILISFTTEVRVELFQDVLIEFLDDQYQE